MKRFWRLETKEPIETNAPLHANCRHVLITKQGAVINYPKYCRRLYVEIPENSEVTRIPTLESARDLDGTEVIEETWFV